MPGPNSSASSAVTAYDVTALIGEGGMGQTYRATDTQLGRDVALKISDAFAADPERLARFQRKRMFSQKALESGVPVPTRAERRGLGAGGPWALRVERTRPFYAQAVNGAVSTDILHFRARVVVTGGRIVSHPLTLGFLAESSGSTSRADDHSYGDHGSAGSGASPSTWYHLVRKYGWRRPRLRIHPAKPKIGLRTTRPDEMWHIDTTVIRLLDGTRASLHAVIDNLSRRILAWRVADTFAPVNSVAVLLDASRGATSSETPVVLADAGVENVNAQVDDLITTGILRRVLAFTELQFSNSMIEAWWRSLTHQRLFLNSLDSVTTVHRLVKFYVDEHNRVLPHSAFRGQTPDEMYFGTGDAVSADLTSSAAAARRARGEANRSASCETCPSLDAAA